jgi:outer membrane protein assembly factor BamB/fibronectin type 3 domain-containing protein
MSNVKICKMKRKMERMKKNILSITLLTFLLSHNTGHTASSPMYRYNLYHTGSISEELYPPLVLRWEGQTYGNVVSLPAIKNGKLYVTSRDGFLRIFDAYTGEEIANYSTAGYIDSSPCIYKGKIYITSSDGKLYCFRDVNIPEDSLEKPLWEFRVENGTVLSSPVAFEDNVYLLPATPENNFYIIDAESGTVKYKIALSQFSQSAPAIYEKNVVFPTNDGKIHNIDLSLNNITWEYQTIGNLGYNSVTIDNKGVVYFIPGGDDFRLYAVDILTGRTLWNTGFLGLPGTYISSIVSSPALAIYDGKRYVLVATSGGALNKYTIYAIDGDNGNILWQRSFGATPKFHTLPAPTIANEVIYVVSPTDKKLYALRLTDGAELWSSQALENEIYVAPVISNGWLYVVDYGGRIYAFEADTSSGGRTVCITSPDNDDVVSAQYVPIYGTVNSDALSSYKLEYSVYKDTDIRELPWKTIYIGTNTVYRSLLGVWDTTSDALLPDGKYLLRVSAFNVTGSTDSSIVALQLNAPPQPPTNLTAFDTPNDQGYSVTLTWAKSIDDGCPTMGDNDVTEYRIYRSTSPGRGYALHTILPAGTTMYMDNTVIKNQLYYYFLTAYDGLSESLPTSTVSVRGIDNIPPGAPRDVSGTAGDRMAKLSWKANIEPDVSHYNIYRDSGVGYILITSVDKNNTTYYDYGLVNGITYYYKLTAVDDSYLESLPSYPPVVIVPSETADIIPPAKVTDLSAAPVISEEGSILLEWTSTGDNNYSGDLVNAKYHIRYTQRSAPDCDHAEYSITISTTTKANQKENYKISSLIPNTTYYFWVKIEDKRNNISEASNCATGVPAGIPPGRITDLCAMPGNTEGSVILTWTAPGNNGYVGEIHNGKYKIKYSTSPYLLPGNTMETVFPNIKTSPGKKEIYALSGFLENIVYTFCVLTADDYNLWSVESNTASTKGSGIPPGKITDLAAKPGNTIGSILLTWTAPGDNAYADILQNGIYEIKYTSNPLITSPEYANYSLHWSTTTTPGNKEIKVITNLIPNATYYFWIRAIDKFNNAGAFSEITYTYAQIDIFPPAPPANLLLADVPDDYGKNVWLYWERSADDGGGDNDVVEYWIYRGTSTENMSLLAKVARNTTSYLDTSVVPNVKFYYYIKSRDSYNLSIPSEIVSIVPISEWQEVLTDRFSVTKSIDNAEIVFPAESVSQGCYVIIHKLTKPDKEFPNAGVPKFAHALPEAWEIKFSTAEVKLLKSITIKLPYSEEYVNKYNIQEENLRVFFWNEKSKQWEVVNTSTPHPEEKRVWITAVPYFALYRIMEFIPFGEVLRNEECYIYPNPAVKCDIIYFKFRLYDKADVHIYIYTISGEPVAHLSLEKNKTQAYAVHEIPWWVRNVPAGVYIAKIEGKSDKNCKVLTKKFAIVN